MIFTQDSLFRSGSLPLLHDLTDVIVLVQASIEEQYIMGRILLSQFRVGDRLLQASLKAMNHVNGVSLRTSEEPTPSSAAIAQWRSVPSRKVLQDCLLRLREQLPDSADLPQLQAWIETWHWLTTFHTTSQLLIAVIDAQDLTLQYANDYGCRLLNVSLDAMVTGDRAAAHMGTILRQRLSDTDFAAVFRLYRRHVLHFVLRDLYRVDPSQCRLLESPAMVALPSPTHSEPRYIEFWLRSQDIQVTRLDVDGDEFADLNLTQLSPEQWQSILIDSDRVDMLEQRLDLSHYQIEGRLLLEGLDVTEREIIHRITQLLIDRDSILHTQRFQQVNHHLRSLFRTDQTVILTVEKEQIRVFMSHTEYELNPGTYPLDVLKDSHTLRAIQTNRVVIVQDLAVNCPHELGRQLLQQGVRSLLLIPLVSQSAIFQAQTSTHRNPPKFEVVGLVGLMSDRPYHFNELDCCHAKLLIPAFTRALTSAQRQLVQRRFITNIHPSVEWRFLQEAERRSLGLPAEPIVFNNVSPLYGISDIRGSSDARNAAIQADLIQQFRLGLAVAEAIADADDNALAHQLKLDLQERIERLQGKITVDAEVTEIRYLRHHLECYFDHFDTCGDAAKVAIQAYRDACNNEHACVYVARAEYDQAIARINGLLRETWEHWQQRMQQITPHYCDIEVTDGIDHMIYAGQSIDPKFGKFQLRSLRYEQLRAVCDCARVIMKAQAELQSTMEVTHLVLVQDSTVDIFHDETTEKLFDVRGTRDTRYEIVKKRIDKAMDEEAHNRITQPRMLTLVYSTTEEYEEYQRYLHYLMREQLVDTELTQGSVEPLQGVTGLKFIRVRILPESDPANASD